MDNSLLITDTLLYITVILVSFGIVALDTAFTKGLISLGVAAVIVIARAYLKNKEILKLKKELIRPQ